MWDFIGILGLLATFFPLLGSIVLGVKKNILWEKWLSAAGVAFLVFIVGAVNAPTITNDKNTITAPPPQQINNPSQAGVGAAVPTGAIAQDRTVKNKLQPDPDFNLDSSQRVKFK